MISGIFMCLPSKPVIPGVNEPSKVSLRQELSKLMFKFLNILFNLASNFYGDLQV